MGHFKILRFVVLFFMLSAFVICEDEVEESESQDDTTEEEEDPVVVLTSENFDDFLAEADTALVEFYAPWCGHCKQLEPAYRLAAKDLKASKHPVLLGKVDATVEESLAGRFEVRGYPTLKVFKKGEAIEYEGPRHHEGIVDYMNIIGAPDWKPPPPAVVVLTQENFADTVNKEKLMLVEFYAPWCGHCKQLAPKYEKAARMLQMGDEPLILAKVDATEEPELAKEYGVSGYPTLKVFRQGKAFEYTGPRDEQGIVEFMNKQRGDPAKPVTAAAFKHFVHVEDVSVLAFFDNEEDPRLQTYQDALHDMRDTYHLGYTTDKSLLDKYKAKAGSVLVLNAERFYTKFEPKWHTLNIKEDTKPAAITKFIKDHQFPLVGAYDGPLKERYEQEKTVCVVFYSVDWSFDHREATQMWRRKIAEIAQDYDSIRFAVANEETNADLMGSMGFVDVGEDLSMGILGKGKKFAMPAMDEFDSDEIREFLDNYLVGNLSPHIKSEPVPKKQGLVKVVVGKTFDKIVNDPTKDVLIEMYAPWCGHCKKLEPTYKALAKKLKGAKNLVIAKMDATANDAPDNFKAQGFPTIYFSPADSKESPLKYEGGREVDDFVSYLKEKATVSLGPLKDEL